MQQSSLRARVELELQRLVILLGDVEAPGHANEASHAERLARLALLLVFRESQVSVTLRPSSLSGTLE